MDLSEGFVVASIGQLLAQSVSNYLKEPQNRTEFEKWYFEHYGVSYSWKFANQNIEETEERQVG